jgi:hypothetical protein
VHCRWNEDYREDYAIVGARTHCNLIPGAPCFESSSGLQVACAVVFVTTRTADYVGKNITPVEFCGGEGDVLIWYSLKPQGFDRKKCGIYP